MVAKAVAEEPPAEYDPNPKPDPEALALLVAVVGAAVEPKDETGLDPNPLAVPKPVELAKPLVEAKAEKGDGFAAGVGFAAEEDGATIVGVTFSLSAGASRVAPPEMIVGGTCTAVAVLGETVDTAGPPKGTAKLVLVLGFCTSGATIGAATAGTDAKGEALDEKEAKDWYMIETRGIRILLALTIKKDNPTGLPF